MIPVAVRLTGELDLVWERSLPHRPVAVALDPLGKALAVADEAGVHVFDDTGRAIWRHSNAGTATPTLRA